MKTSNYKHDYLGAVANSLGQCRPYEMGSGILVAPENWVRRTVASAIGTENHPTLMF